MRSWRSRRAGFAGRRVRSGRGSCRCPTSWLWSYGQNPAIALSIELHPRTYDLPIYDRKWLAFFPGLRPESLAAVVRLAALAENRFARRLAAAPGGRRVDPLAQPRPRLAGQLAGLSPVGRPDPRGDLKRSRWISRVTIMKTDDTPKIGREQAHGDAPVTTDHGRRATDKRRIVSLDQFRGYTVVGMLFVNFLGGYQVVPAVFKHHNTYCSYADTIMPQFFFAVGFAYRLTFLAPACSDGFCTAAAAVFRRNAGPDPARLRALPSRRRGQVLGRAREAGSPRFSRAGVSARAVPDVGPHRDHVDLDPARDRGRARHPRRSS